ncbi:Ribosomal protein S12 methylthiotransferase RimO [Gracilariopsis chorda]|uniref:Ribosomal protein S12 methylthiotransferase RimO n=1 Tax=Gracilariopsis chorda TaxID=448386 RepID=A0A2V3IT21_9FLOR|nr:Ribosomal protein S12 methylthiotransferase RimO [Gracilariopsis chorda]|eukprot:PXF45249.1 Ribosomal protein S12 methylthiotransferase RimO [Gracilariopsis chorda]
MAFISPAIWRRQASRAETIRSLCKRQPSATAMQPVSTQHRSNTSPTTVSLVSLGCPKNVTDAEVMLSDMAKHNIKIQASDAENPADVVVVNTCGFVEDAKRESIDAILQAAEGKERGTKGVIITGCLAQRYADLLAEELPEVDAVVGFEHYHELPQRVRALAANEKQESLEKVKVGITDVPFRPEHERFRLGPKHSVYVRLAEGCSHSCTFCAIPGQFRGKFRSKDWDSLTKEIDTLVEAGAKELVFIAEDTNQFGMDFPPQETRRLSDLLHHVASNNTNAKWLRLLYCYPSYFTNELIEAIAQLDVVCKYIDMPLQHISDRILKRMNRPGRKHTEELLSRLRQEIPDLALRTTFIVGFPGETEEDHRELVDFIKTNRFNHAGFFVYSEEEGTPAATYDDQVPLEIREYRRDELVSIQQRIQEEIASERVGQVLHVLVDRIENGHSIGRCRFDAPEIDGCVHILQQIEPGTILKVRILGTSSFDLYGEPVE